MSGEFCPANAMAKEWDGGLIPEAELPEQCKIECFFVAKMTAENDAKLASDLAGKNRAYMEVKDDVLREVRIVRRDTALSSPKTLGSFKFRCERSLFME